MTARHRSSPNGTGAALLWRRLFDAAADAEVDAALRAVFAELDQQVCARGVGCRNSGRCCRFDQFGHRLYVTGLEIAWTLTQLGMTPWHEDAPGVGADIRPTRIDPAGACVFQVDNRCTVHTVRPLGCRIFFCQEGTDDWQHELSERFLADLRELHDTHNLPYRYLEWRAGLAEALRVDAG